MIVFTTLGTDLFIFTTQPHLVRIDKVKVCLPHSALFGVQDLPNTIR